jgi:hypothetical protein
MATLHILPNFCEHLIGELVSTTLKPRDLQVVERAKIYDPSI